MFLTAWAKIARGELIMRLPSFRRSHFNPRRPPQPSKSLDKFYVPQSSLSPPPSDNCMIYNRLISRIYHMKSESIDLIQSQANNNDTRRSKIESFSAFLRKAIADGGEDHSKSVKLGIVVDGRVRLGGETMWLDRYFGNVLSFPCVEASVGKLQTMSLNEVAKTVHECISAATTEHFLGLIDYVEVRRPKPPTVEVYYKDENDEAAVVVSSGQRFPVREVDFGWGKPGFGSYYLSWKSETGYIMPMPSSCGNEDWIVYMHLKKKHLDLASHILSPFSPSHMN